VRSGAQAPLTGLFILGVAAAGFAQTTREEAIAQQQEAKAAVVRPHQPSLAERKLLEIEETGGFGVSRGFFWTFGGIKSGSSVAMGPVYGRTFAGGALAQAKVVYSVRNFILGEFLLQSAPLLDGRLVVNGRARWYDAPVLAVYPFGSTSPKVRADYAETKTEFSGQAMLQPARFVYLDAGAGYERIDTGPSDTDRPSVEEIYTPDQLPGLDADPHYVHTYIGGGLDTTTGPGYSRSGTVLGATFHDYRQQNDGPYSFQRTDAIARQLIPILHGNWVIDLSARVSTTNADDGQVVPFFLMPYLGGGRNLRGYQSYRFRDRHTLVVTAEYRWYAQEWVDMAVYYDGGKAVASRSDLNLDGLRSNVGIGIRFHTPGNTALRLEVAAGNEGPHLIVGWGPIFRR
jgi:hypothetical protein